MKCMPSACPAVSEGTGTHLVLADRFWKVDKHQHIEVVIYKAVLLNFRALQAGRQVADIDDVWIGPHMHLQKQAEVCCQAHPQTSRDSINCCQMPESY